MTTQWHKDMYDAINAEYQRMLDAGGNKGLTLVITAGISTYNEPLKLTYIIGSYGDTDKVEGADLHAVFTEYMRRKQWTEANKPILLIGESKTIDNEETPEHVSQPPKRTDDDIPF